MEIIALLQCLCPTLTLTTVRQLSRIICALLAMSGRVTMRGLSHWAGESGSYRTVQRCFYTVIPCLQVLLGFFRQHLFRTDDVYILAGDEVVVTKAGKHTFGLDRFFPTLLQRPVPSLAFFALSLVSTRERCAFPLSVEQLIRTEAEKATRQANAETKPAAIPEPRRGRPKGSKNKNKAEVTLTSELQHTAKNRQSLCQALSKP